MEVLLGSTRGLLLKNTPLLRAKRRLPEKNTQSLNAAIPFLTKGFIDQNARKAPLAKNELFHLGWDLSDSTFYVRFCVEIALFRK